MTTTAKRHTTIHSLDRTCAGCTTDIVLGSVRVGRDRDALRQARRYPDGRVEFRSGGAWTLATEAMARTFIHLPGL
jgi:hypothetical protein